MNSEPAVIIGAIQALVLAVWAVLQATGAVSGDISEYVASIGAAVLAIVSAVWVRSIVTPPANLPKAP